MMFSSLITRRSYRLLLVVSVLSGCADQTTNRPAVAAPAAGAVLRPVSAISAIQAKAAASVEAEPLNTEYLEWNGATLNGRLPMISTRKAMLKELGQLDSLITPNMDDVCGSFFNKPFQLAYVKMTDLEVYGDRAVIRTIDFQRQPKLTLQAGSIRLSHSTTLAELARSFPVAVSKQSSLNVHGLGKMTAVSLATGQRSSDDSWLLLFKGSKLVRIDYWMPC
ncbi:MAG: hypothetical protein H7Z21_17235 [Hymenobacter sp.]|nr:hypothetical protein [Hymenobacter sp.]